MADARLDQTDLYSVLDTPDTLVHQDFGNSTIAAIRMHSQPAKFANKIGVSADLQIHGRGTDDPARAILGYQKQAVLGIDQPRQQALIVKASIGVVGLVGRE